MVIWFSIFSSALHFSTMADRFTKSMLAALKKPTLDQLYRRLRDLDYSQAQVDERMAVMLKAILQLESQEEARESAMEVVVMVGYTSNGISNQEQARWLSWGTDGGREDLTWQKILAWATPRNMVLASFPSLPSQARRGGFRSAANLRR